MLCQNRLEEVLKVDSDGDAKGGDDPADALRYMEVSNGQSIPVRKLNRI